MVQNILGEIELFGKFELVSQIPILLRRFNFGSTLLDLTSLTSICEDE